MTKMQAYQGLKAILKALKIEWFLAKKIILKNIEKDLLNVKKVGIVILVKRGASQTA